jgi:hypothetical protein
MTRSLCAHCQRCAFSTPAQQWERQHHVRNTVRPRPPLHRSGRTLLRSRLVASQDSRTRPVGRTRRCTRSTGAAGSNWAGSRRCSCVANPPSAVVNSRKRAATAGSCRLGFLPSWSHVSIDPGPDAPPFVVFLGGVSALDPDGATGALLRGLFAFGLVFAGPQMGGFVVAASGSNALPGEVD